MGEKKDKKDKKKSKKEEPAQVHIDTAVQSESSYQKQPTIFSAKYQRLLGRKAAKSKKLRYYKNIGLGYKTPKAAINGKYIDKKCPFTSDVSIRGRILRGQVVSVKMNRTIIVRRDYLHYYPKYRRYEKRHKNIPAHLSPAFRVKEGDVVTLGQCRPLSKTIRFNVIKVEPQNSQVLSKKKRFRIF